MNFDTLDYFILGGILALIVLVFAAFYGRTEVNYRMNARRTLYLCGLLLGALFTPLPFAWIYLPFFFIVIFRLFNERNLKFIFEIEEDSLFNQNERQIWEKFRTPPELKTKSSGPVPEGNPL